MTLKFFEVQPDYQEFLLTGAKTQNYKLRRDQTYSYYDIWWNKTMTETCTFDDLTGKTTRYLKDRLKEFDFVHNFLSINEHKN